MLFVRENPLWKWMVTGGSHILGYQPMFIIYHMVVGQGPGTLVNTKKSLAYLDVVPPKYGVLSWTSKHVMAKIYQFIIYGLSYTLLANDVVFWSRPIIQKWFSLLSCWVSMNEWISRLAQTVFLGWPHWFIMMRKCRPKKTVYCHFDDSNSYLTVIWGYTWIYWIFKHSHVIPPIDGSKYIRGQ